MKAQLCCHTLNRPYWTPDSKEFLPGIQGTGKEHRTFDLLWVFYKHCYTFWINPSGIKVSTFDNWIVNTSHWFYLVTPNSYPVLFGMFWTFVSAWVTFLEIGANTAHPSDGTYTGYNSTLVLKVQGSVHPIWPFDCAGIDQSLILVKGPSGAWKRNLNLDISRHN